MKSEISFEKLEVFLEIIIYEYIYLLVLKKNSWIKLLPELINECNNLINNMVIYF